MTSDKTNPKLRLALSILDGSIRPLPETKRKNGCVYRQVQRSDRTAMYSLSHTDGGRTIGYEVFKIKNTPAGTDHRGIKHEACEHFPSNEEFGSIAWAFTTREFAQVKYDQLERRPS